MKIVDWGDIDIEPKTGDKERRQIFKTLLQRVIEERWQGKISRSERQYEKIEAPRIEIRKHLGEANVLMVIGKQSSSWNNLAPSDKTVTMVSMNGTAMLTEDDFLEMSLAASEARGMYAALMEKDNENG